MKVEFNGSSMRAEMDGMGTPASAASVDLSFLDKILHGTTLAVGALILALLSLGVYSIGAFMSVNYAEVLPEFLLEIYTEAGILSYLPMYLTRAFGIGSIVLAIVAVTLLVASAVRLIREQRPISMGARCTGVICDGLAIVIAVVVIVLALVSF